MTATPAWPLNSLPRLFIDENLSVGSEYGLDGSSFHYLCRVIRKNVGDHVKCFDDRSGEYLAEITNIDKRKCYIIMREKLREKELVPDLWLCAAPIKRDRWAMIAEKSCELGISTFLPIQTQRTIIDKIKNDKLRNIMIEAAEQCERTAIPKLRPLQKLTNFLDDFPPDRTLFFCDERGGQNYQKVIENNKGAAALLIGPEGGFTDQENTLISAHPRAQAISLGPRILRTETAAITAISIWMSQAGDWQ